MKRNLILALCFALLASMLSGCGSQGELKNELKSGNTVESPYKTVISEKQNFSTLCLKSCTSRWDDEDGLYIYTETDDSIPYVLIWRYSDVPIDAGQFLEESVYAHMVESYGSNMIEAGTVKNYSVGGKTLPGILFVYKVGEYTVESLRLMYKSGDDLINFTAKYLSGDSDVTMEALNLAVQNFEDGKNGTSVGTGADAVAGSSTANTSGTATAAGTSTATAAPDPPNRPQSKEQAAKFPSHPPPALP